MAGFKTWLLAEEHDPLEEMANLLPQTAEDHEHPERVRTTHLGVPAWAPTVYWVLINRDKAKYPAGMTVTQIANSIVERSERRDDGSGPIGYLALDPSVDIKAWLREANNFNKLKKGLASMLNHSPDFEKSDRDTSGSARGAAVYLPTAEAEHRGSGVKALSMSDREKAKAEFAAKQSKDNEVPGTDDDFDALSKLMRGEG